MLGQFIPLQYTQASMQGTPENRQLHLVDEHCDFPVQLHIVIFNSSGGAISHAVATGS